MDKFENDTSLMNGKGESNIDWITVNGAHIPIKNDESKKEAVDNFINDKDKQDTIQSLVNNLKKVKNIKYKELRDYIKNLNPIKLTINDDEIIAQFDKYTAKKNIYGKGLSDDAGYNYKLSNISKIPQIVKTSKYKYSQVEKGKKTSQHIGVKKWHYFINTIETDNGNFNVVVNIRDKGNEQFIYEIAIKKA